MIVAGVLAAAFVAGTYAAPLLSTSGSALGRLLPLVYAPMCHQVAERSLAIGDGVQAVCARCGGLYLGGVLGLAMAVACLGFLRRRLRPVLLAVAWAPTLVDVLLPWLGLPNLPNLPRLLVALPAGLVAGLFLAIGIADLFTRVPTPNPNPASATKRSATLEVFDG